MLQLRFCLRRLSTTRGPAALTSLVAAYREHGHLLASLDPLGLPDWTRQHSAERYLDPSSHGLTETDMSSPAVGSPLAVGLEANEQGLSNGEVLRELRR